MSEPASITLFEYKRHSVTRGILGNIYCVRYKGNILKAGVRDEIMEKFKIILDGYKEVNLD